jgi:hypothetical protein
MELKYICGEFCFSLYRYQGKIIRDDAVTLLNASIFCPQKFTNIKHNNQLKSNQNLGDPQRDRAELYQKIISDKVAPHDTHGGIFYCKIEAELRLLARDHLNSALLRFLAKKNRSTKKAIDDFIEGIEILSFNKGEIINISAQSYGSRDNRKYFEEACCFSG